MINWLTVLFIISHIALICIKDIVTINAMIVCFSCRDCNDFIVCERGFIV